MVAYNAIRPAAYVLDPDAGPFAEPYYALAFPQHWRQAILDLYRHGEVGPGPVPAGPDQGTQRRDPRARTRPGIRRGEGDAQRRQAVALHRRASTRSASLQSADRELAAHPAAVPG